MANRLLTYRPLFLIALLFIAAAAGSARAQTAPEREQLLNGLTVLYSRNGDANVLLKLRLHSGAVFDLAGKAGTMAVLGDALFPEATTSEYVRDELGGKLEVTTTYDSIEVTLSGQAGELERMVEMIRNAIITTNLSPESVATLREERIKKLSQPGPAELADRAVAVRLFGTFPYANPPQGTPESVAKIDRADLMLARDRFLHADNATLVVIGGVDKARVMRALRQLLGPWQKSDRTIPATFRQPNPADARTLIVNQSAAKTAEIRLAVRGLARSDHDTAGAAVLAMILRDRWQLAVPELTHVFARHEAYALPGVFVMGGAVPSASAAKAIAAAQDAIRVMTTTAVTTAELEHARAAAQAELSRPASPAEQLAEQWLDADEYKSDANPAAEISRVTVFDVRRVAERLFKDTPRAIVAVGDAGELKPVLGSNAEVAADIKTPPSTPVKP